ncbi:PREDICTED: collagen alpha-1(III) chain-like [Lipotes vexillifer]|uniref:Collagen alpha-1(III) chain-like n=1 Tax=Lipotes vexillifer TaxID=118797 RepID=A0A340WWJ0_LIPVE|nr:PREDICTED: collagen alpha-1(III) chain-like [Lipotes vexillifer]
MVGRRGPDLGARSPTLGGTRPGGGGGSGGGGSAQPSGMARGLSSRPEGAAAPGWRAQNLKRSEQTESGCGGGGLSHPGDVLPARGAVPTRGPGPRPHARADVRTGGREPERGLQGAPQPHLRPETSFPPPPGRKWNGSGFSPPRARPRGPGGLSPLGPRRRPSGSGGQRRRPGIPSRGRSRGSSGVLAPGAALGGRRACALRFARSGKAGGAGALDSCVSAPLTPPPAPPPGLTPAAPPLHPAAPAAGESGFTGSPSPRALPSLTRRRPDAAPRRGRLRGARSACCQGDGTAQQRPPGPVALGSLTPPGSTPRTRAAHQCDPDRLRQAACGTLCLTRGASPDVGAGLPADYPQVAPRDLKLSRQGQTGPFGMKTGPGPERCPGPAQKKLRNPDLGHKGLQPLPLCDPTSELMSYPLPDAPDAAPA